jgi:hypothetical protein
VRGTLTLAEMQERSREQAQRVTHLMNIAGTPLVEWEGTRCRPLSYEERLALWTRREG